MIETIVLNVLNEQLGTISAYMEVPEQKPSSYVVLQKTGSKLVNQLPSATVAVQSIAGTLYEAASLNELVKSIMENLPWLTEEVFGAELDSDYNFTDITTKERRYQAVYNITYKETE